MKEEELTSRFNWAIFTIGLLIIGLLAAITIPNVIRYRENRDADICRSHLADIRGLKDQTRTNNQSLWDLAEKIKGKYTCPRGGVYYLGDQEENPRCSYKGTPWAPHTLELGR